MLFVTDLARAIPLPTQFEFMAVSSYGSSTSSSGVVRILKDLDRDIHDRDVLIVEDVVDSGLTLSWLLRNLTSRHPRTLRVCTLLRKPDAVGANVEIAYVGFDIPNEFVVGYGLDYDERYRDLSYIGTLDPRIYQCRSAKSAPTPQSPKSSPSAARAPAGPSKRAAQVPEGCPPTVWCRRPRRWITPCPT